MFVAVYFWQDFRKQRGIVSNSKPQMAPHVAPNTAAEETCEGNPVSQHSQAQDIRVLIEWNC